MSKKKKRKESQIAGFRGVGDPRGNALTTKEELFIEAFIGLAQGDAYKAAQLAGYSTSSIGLSKIALKPIREEIDRRLIILDELDAAMTPLEIQGLWRRLSKHPDPLVQLRASENAAKARGMFIQKTEIDVNINQTQGIQAFDQFLEELDEDNILALLDVIRARKERQGRIIEAEVIDA